MNVKISIIMACVLFVSVCRADEPDTKRTRRTQIGLGVSVNTSWMTGFDQTVHKDFKEIREEADNPKIGVAFGPHFNYFVTPRFSVMIGPQVGLYGTRYKYFETAYHELGMSDNDRIITENLVYFHVPISFDFYVAPKLVSLNAGVYASALLSARRKDPKEVGTRYDPDFYFGSAKDVDSDYRSADAGLTVGATVELGKMKLVASYMHGLLDVSDLIRESHANRAISLTLILKFTKN